MALVSENGLSIEHIDNPSKEVQLATVKKDGHVIKWIDNPTEKVKQLAAQ